MKSMFTMDKMSIAGLTFDTIRKFILRHEREFVRLDKLHRYYIGRHDILNRQKEKNMPNSKVVCNHAKEITDTATGYFIGNSVAYTGEHIEKVLEWFKMGEIDSVDMAIAKDMSKFGRGYELVCMTETEEVMPKSYCIHPKNIFVVYDDTVIHAPLFAVYYYPVYDAEENHTGYKVCLYTKDSFTLFATDTSFRKAAQLEQREHYFDEVPVVEYSNNEEQQGDYEQVISLIDAYNQLMSDRVNDKEQFVDAILLLINAMLGDNEEERTAAKEQLQQNKMLELPAESDARYLTRTFDENGVEILKKAIEQDIHKYAQVPCLSDENFAGNTSGVAMEYKLLGLEMLTKVKERFFKKGLKQRFKLYSAIARLKGIECGNEAEANFTRGLPKNIAELSNVVSELQDIVPDEILLSLLPFVKNPKEATEIVKQQKEANAEIQKQSFGVVNNTAGDIDEE